MTLPTGPSRIEWTGERCIPTGDEVQGIYEHLHRYYFASQFTAGRRVLDVASGEGYGAALLAEHATEVVAIELDSASVAHSRLTYDARNLTFVEGSMLELSSHVAGSFDVVVCFEAIEHVAAAEQSKLVDEMAAVLAPEGMLLVSTPDRATYNASIHEPNPFHVSELDQGELLALLTRSFENVALWGQNVVGGSRIVTLDDDTEAMTTEQLVARRDGRWVELERAEPVYLIAAASRVPLQATARSSYLIDPTAEALRERDRRVSTRDRRIRELKEENSTLHRENVRLRSESWTRGLVRRTKTRVRSLTSAAGSRRRDR